MGVVQASCCFRNPIPGWRGGEAVGGKQTGDTPEGFSVAPAMERAGPGPEVSMQWGGLAGEKGPAWGKVLRDSCPVGLVLWEGPDFIP